MTYNKKLEDILKDNPSGLEREVIEDALKAESAEGYLKDLLNHGCVSGMVGSLIAYYQTKAFYIKHMDEIEELYQEAKENTGDELPIGTPLSNWMAWFGYEETARKIADRIGLNY